MTSQQKAKRIGSDWVRLDQMTGIRTGDAATGDTLSAGVAGLHPMWSPGPPGPPLLGQQQHSSHILSHDHHHHTDHCSTLDTSAACFIMQFKFLLSDKCNINIAYNAGRFVDVITY